MKKIIALMLVLASILSLSACKVNKNNGETEPYDANEFQENMSKLEAEQSKRAAKEAEEASEVLAEIDEYVEKIGKTKPKTQIVVESDYALGRKYLKFEFNKKGEFKNHIIYYFFDTYENYKAVYHSEKNRDDATVVDHDKDTHMVAVRLDEYVPNPYDTIYDAYASEAVMDLGYTIVE